MSPWLVPLLLAVVLGAAVAGWMLRRDERPHGPVTWVANTDYVSRLPGYRRRARLLRGGLAVAAAALALSSLSAAALSARPVDRDVRAEILATRDIVLCLDVSGSMIELDSEIVRVFSRLVDSFEGERIALSIWNNTSRTVFPLTDDYGLVQDELDAAATALNVDLDSWVYDPEQIARLEDFLTGTVSLDGESSSLVGDGLASCALAFDEQDSERSRSIILATDNLVRGTPLYSLPAAHEVAAERDVKVHALYASLEDASSAEARAELEMVITDGGGLFYEASDPEAAEAIIRDIQAQQAVDLDADPEVVETDRPDKWYGWLLGGLGVFLALLWRLRA